MNNFQQLPLRDIHLPDPVSWWPPALGWWLLLILAATVAFVAWWGLCRFKAGVRQRRLGRLVRCELDRIEADYQATADAGRSLQDLSILLRRFAITRFSRHGAAGLCGDQWADWLRQHDTDGTLNEQCLRQLVHGPYQMGPAADVPALLSNIRRWLDRDGAAKGAT